MDETTGTTYKYGITPGQGVNTGGRKKLTMKMSGPDIPSPVDVDKKIQELQQKMGKKPKKRKPIPGANTELWPGGPGVDTNDIRLT